MDHFDEDNDGTITYDEFIAKVLPPEFVHGGGGIMDFESDDPDFKGCVTKKEQLFALKKQIKKQLLTKAKNMREMFRRMGGAGDGEVDEYPEAAFNLVGNIEEAIEKGKKMLAEV